MNPLQKNAGVQSRITRDVAFNPGGSEALSPLARDTVHFSAQEQQPKLLTTGLNPLPKCCEGYTVALDKTPEALQEALSFIFEIEKNEYLNENLRDEPDFLTAWLTKRVEKFTEVLQSPEFKLYCIRNAAQELVAVGVLTPLEGQPAVGYMRMAYVKKAERRKGLGVWLVEQREKDAKPLGFKQLIVAVRGSSAEKKTFWEDRGYEEYYASETPDTVFLRKKL